MTLVDTSVWVEYLRGTDSPSTRYVRERLGSDLFTTEPVLMELLAGARHGASTARLERLLLSQSWARLEPALVTPTSSTSQRSPASPSSTCAADRDPARGSRSGGVACGEPLVHGPGRRLLDHRQPGRCR